MDTKIAVVTGANRGLGFAISRLLAMEGIKVVLTSRDGAKGQAATEKLQAQGLDVVWHQLSVTDSDSIQQLADFIEQQFGKLDILINNAGINPESSGSSALEIQLETLQTTMKTNVYGPLLLSQALVPLMKIHNYGRIVNLSAGMGLFKEMEAGFPAYCLSKAALNALTIILAAELQETGIKVNAASPGWAKTDMGGSDAPKTAEEGADTIVWLATCLHDIPNGGFWRDRQLIPW